jgi:hypothetical protein
MLLAGGWLRRNVRLGWAWTLDGLRMLPRLPPGGRGTWSRGLVRLDSPNRSALPLYYCRFPCFGQPQIQIVYGFG